MNNNLNIIYTIFPRMARKKIAQRANFPARMDNGGDHGYNICIDFHHGGRHATIFEQNPALTAVVCAAVVLLALLAALALLRRKEAREREAMEERILGRTGGDARPPARGDV